MRVPVRVRDHLDVPDAQIRRLEDADGGKRKFGSFIATILKLHYCWIIFKNFYFGLKYTKYNF